MIKECQPRALAHACNLPTQEVETERIQIQDQQEQKAHQTPSQPIKI
jgi:hypothetical protein